MYDRYNPENLGGSPFSSGFLPETPRQKSLAPIARSAADALRLRVAENGAQTRVKALSKKMESTSNVTLQEILAKSSEQSIATVRKDNVFDSKVTQAEKEIIMQRVRQQQQVYQEYIKRERSKKLVTIAGMFEGVSIEECVNALHECDEKEGEVMVKLTEPTYLSDLRKRIAQAYMQLKEESEAKTSGGGGGACSSTPQDHSSGRHTSSSSSTSGSLRSRLKKKQEALYAAPKKKKSGFKGFKLRLDDAIAQGDFTGWSQARITAYRMIDTNPNAYYYRFNAPGESQKNGAWSKQEREMFFKRMAERGVDGQWGIFSMAIPGRVGYQCANFYRTLVKNGEIKDENYTLEDGKLVHRGGRGKKGSSKSAEPRERAAPASPMSSPKPKTGTKRSRAQHHNNDSDEDTIFAKDLTDSEEEKEKEIKRKRSQVILLSAAGNMNSSREDSCVADSCENIQDSPLQIKTRSSRRRQQEDSTTTKIASGRQIHSVGSPLHASSGGFDMSTVQHVNLKSENSEQQESGGLLLAMDDSEESDGEPDPNNPLPGHIDPITLEEVRRPALSPYGHVMGYGTWVRVLSEEPKNTCPFTKKPLAKRELIKLTHENIAEHKSKIINF